MTDPPLTAVVTGGASGIGLRVVERLRENGAQVVVADSDPSALDALARASGSGIIPLCVDVRNESDIQRMVAAAGECGNFRLAVNAAGMGEGAPLVDELLTTWERVHSIVLAGTFLSVKHEAREMIKSGLGGAIINVASINANIPTWSSSAYSSAKAGVEMLTKSAALELARYGVRVNCVSPGLVETPMARRTGNLEPAMLERWLQHTPLGRVGNTDDIASAILFLGGDQSMWVTGHNLVVDGGLSLTAGPVTEDLLS